MWYNHTVAYYTAVKKSRALIHTTVCMTLTDVTLRDRNQAQKSPLYIYGKFKNRQNNLYLQKTD